MRDYKGKYLDALDKKRKQKNPKALWKPSFSLGFGFSKSDLESGFDNQREGKPSHLREFVANIHQLFQTTKLFITMADEMNKEKSEWGGARPGAGRKRKGVHYYGFRATQQVHDILSQVEGSKADFINECIIKAISR